MNEIFKKRLSSFLWRVGMMALAMCVAFLSENINLLPMSPVAIGILGLVLGEISKYLNTKTA